MAIFVTLALSVLCAGGSSQAYRAAWADSLRLRIEVLADSSGSHPRTTMRVTLWNDTDHAISVIAPLDWPNESAMLEVSGVDGVRPSSYNFRFPYEFPSGAASPYAARIPPRSFVGTELLLDPGGQSGQAGFSLEPGKTYQATLTLMIFAVGSWARQTLRSNEVKWTLSRSG